MANSTTHAVLPYPVRHARFTIPIPYLDADGDPTDPTTPDTEISKDAGAFADCAEEVTTISGSNGCGYLSLSGAELDCALAAVAAKVASGPKATLAFLQPRNLPVLESGTAGAGASTSLTLAAGTYTGCDLTGLILRTTGGTGGGGTGGANNQARVITAYNTSTRVATVDAWETTPDNTTTYDLLLPTGVAVPAITALRPVTLARQIGVDGNNRVDLGLWLGTAPLALSSQFVRVSVGAIDDALLTAAKFASGAFDAVWSVATRVLTAGTNIVLAKGTGVTGFNDLSAAQVNAEADTALADAGVTTTVTGRIDVALSSLATAANLSTVATNVSTLLTRIPSALFSGITSLAEWLGLIAGKQTGNSTARTELRATGAGSGTYDETADSQEALRDRGDSAWITATGFSTHTAADVWAVGTRTLTAFDAAFKTGYALSSAGVQAIWDALTSALTTVGSIGKLLVDRIDAAISSRSSHSAADVWTNGTRTLTSAANITSTGGTTVPQGGDSFARLGAPAGGSVSADIAAVKAQTAAIETDTQEIGLAGAGLTAVASAANLATAQTAITAIKAITDALTAAAAAKLAASALGIITGTVDDAGFVPTTTEFEAGDITEATGDHYLGRIITFTSGALLGQSTDITGYALVGGRGHFTCTALTDPPSDGQTFVIS